MALVYLCCFVAILAWPAQAHQSSDVAMPPGTGRSHALQLGPYRLRHGAAHRNDPAMMKSRERILQRQKDQLRYEKLFEAALTDYAPALQLEKGWRQGLHYPKVAKRD